MTWSDVFHFKGVVEGGDDFLDVCIACYHEVKPTSDKADARVDGSRGGNDLVDTRVRAPDYDHDAFWRVDSQR